MEPIKVSDSLNVKDDKSNKITTLLLTKEKQIALITKKETQIYKQFLNNFQLYLTKLGNAKLVKYVSRLNNSDGIYLGIGEAKTNNELVFVRILLFNNKLAGVVLNSEYFNINLTTGETDSIDSCIYAAYFGMIRAGILTNQSKVAQDFELHKLCITFIYQILSKSLTKIINISGDQLNGVLLGCGYLYFKHYLLKKHLVAMSGLKKLFKNSIPSDVLKLYIDKLDNKSNKAVNMKQIGSVLLDLDIIQSNPNQVIIQLLTNMGSNAFYNLIGSIDHLIALICILNYQTELYDAKLNLKSQINKTIEDHIDINYLNKLKYSIIYK